MDRAEELAGRVEDAEGIAEEELAAIGDALAAYEAKGWRNGKVPGGYSIRAKGTFSLRLSTCRPTGPRSTSRCLQSSPATKRPLLRWHLPDLDSTLRAKSGHHTHVPLPTTDGREIP